VTPIDGDYPNLELPVNLFVTIGLLVARSQTKLTEEIDFGEATKAFEKLNSSLIVSSFVRITVSLD
jgi:hypothetical protein